MTSPPPGQPTLLSQWYYCSMQESLSLSLFPSFVMFHTTLRFLQQLTLCLHIWDERSQPRSYDDNYLKMCQIYHSEKVHQANIWPSDVRMLSRGVKKHFCISKLEWYIFSKMQEIVQARGVTAVLYQAIWICIQLLLSLLLLRFPRWRVVTKVL